jgi:predicted PurR-regulated permease PerM
MDTTQFGARLFWVLATLALIWMSLLVLKPFLIPLLWASVLAFLLQPLARRLRTKIQSENTVASLLTAGTALGILLPVVAIGSMVLKQALALASSVRAEAAERHVSSVQLMLGFGPVRWVLLQLQSITQKSETELKEYAYDFLQNASEQLAKIGSSLIAGTLGTVTQLALTLFVLYFFVRDAKNISARLVHLIPMPYDRAIKLRQTLGQVARGVMLGTLITSLVQGTLTSIGFLICSLPNPLLFGVVAAFASLIPFVGTALVWGPGALMLLATGHTGMGIFLVLWGIVLVGGSDNVVRTWVVAESSNTSTLLVFIGVLGGISAFGLSGLLVGPLLLTLVVSLTEMLRPETSPTVAPQ